MGWFHVVGEENGEKFCTYFEVDYDADTLDWRFGLGTTPGYSMNYYIHTVDERVYNGWEVTFFQFED